MLKNLILLLLFGSPLVWAEQIVTGQPCVEGAASPTRDGESWLRWFRTEDTVSAFVVRHGERGAMPVSLEAYVGEQRVLRIDDLAKPLPTDPRFLLSDCTPFPPLKNGTLNDRYVICYDRQRQVTFLLVFDKKTGAYNGDLSPDLLGQVVTWWNATHKP